MQGGYTMKISLKHSLITLFLAVPLVAEISITTLSDWDMNDFDENTLFKNKEPLKPF
jgi:hypothetical protein